MAKSKWTKFWRFAIDNGEFVDVEAIGRHLPAHDAAWYIRMNILSPTAKILHGDLIVNGNSVGTVKVVA